MNVPLSAKDWVGTQQTKQMSVKTSKFRLALVLTRSSFTREKRRSEELRISSTKAQHSAILVLAVESAASRGRK